MHSRTDARVPRRPGTCPSDQRDPAAQTHRRPRSGRDIRPTRVTLHSRDWPSETAGDPWVCCRRCGWPALGARTLGSRRPRRLARVRPDLPVSAPPRPSHGSLPSSAVTARVQESVCGASIALRPWGHAAGLQRNTQVGRPAGRKPQRPTQPWVREPGQPNVSRDPSTPPPSSTSQWQLPGR
jgi:hypothetical protein